MSQDASQTTISTAPSKEELEAQLVAQGELIAELHAKVQELQSATPSPAKRAATSAPTFKIGNKEFRVKHGLYVRDEGGLAKKDAGQIAADKGLRESLVQSNSSAVEAV